MFQKKIAKKFHHFVSWQNIVKAKMILRNQTIHTCCKHSRPLSYYYWPIIDSLQECADGKAVLWTLIRPIPKEQAALFVQMIYSKSVFTVYALTWTALVYFIRHNNSVLIQQTKKQSYSEMKYLVFIKPETFISSFFSINIILRRYLLFNYTSQKKLWPICICPTDQIQKHSDLSSRKFLQDLNFQAQFSAKQFKKKNLFSTCLKINFC